MVADGRPARSGSERDGARGAAGHGPALRPEGPRRVSSTELLGDRRELIIEHAGEVYHLRCTGKGKLILTK